MEDIPFLLRSRVKGGVVFKDKEVFEVAPVECALLLRAATEIERLQGIIENMREVRTTLALGGDV